MKTKKLLLLAALSCLQLFSLFPSLAFAQEASSKWLAVGLTLSSLSYQEPDVMSEKGINGGAQIELFYYLNPTMNFSIFGGYWDGRLYYDGSTFSGTPVKVMTADYLSDTRLNFNMDFSPVSVSVGYGKRNWYNDLVVSYRRRTEYTFVPVKIKYHSGPIYYGIEYDVWLGGINKSHMSDVGGGRSDVEMKQNSGSGIGLEAGWNFGSAPGTAVFLSLHKWDVEASETSFDGVSNLVEPKNNTITATLGIGLVY